MDEQANGSPTATWRPWTGPYATVTRWYDECDSTSTQAARFHADCADAQLPLLVVAALQTAGRGRIGRAWHADTGTLTFTLVDSAERLRLSNADVPRLALLAGLAIAEAIEHVASPIAAKIKWPNDVYVDGGKVAGVLVESLPGHGRRDPHHGDAANQSPDPNGGTHDTVAGGQRRVAIGIGVNVSTDRQRLAADLRPHVRSLSEVTGRALDRFDVLDAILQRFAEHTAALREEPAVALQEINAGLRQRCWLTGKQITLRQGGREVRGQCAGIDDDGALRVLRGSEVLTVQSGEIVRVVG